MNYVLIQKIIETNKTKPHKNSKKTYTLCMENQLFCKNSLQNYIFVKDWLIAYLLSLWRNVKSDLNNLFPLFQKKVRTFLVDL